MGLRTWNIGFPFSKCFTLAKTNQSLDLRTNYKHKTPLTPNSNNIWQYVNLGSSPIDISEIQEDVFDQQNVNVIECHVERGWSMWVLGKDPTHNL